MRVARSLAGTKEQRVCLGFPATIVVWLLPTGRVLLLTSVAKSRVGVRVRRVAKARLASSAALATAEPIALGIGLASASAPKKEKG